MASTSGSAPKKMKRSHSETEGEEYEDETKKALEEFEICQNEINLINEKVSEEILKVEEKFNKFRIPFFKQRNEIIQRIPHFWATAFANHPHLSAILGEQQEEDCLHYLNKIELKEGDDDLAYSITFHFDDNPYFKNKILSKAFTLNPSSKCPPQNTIIQWKEGHDITKMYKAKKFKRKKPAVEEETFFSWFSANDHLAHEIGEVIRDDMWQNPLQYYLLPDLEEVGHNMSDDEGHDSVVSEMDEDEGDYEEEEDMVEEDEGDYSGESERIEDEEEY